MNIKYLSIVSAIAGILILYMLSLFTQTPLISISEVPEYEGQTITTNGTVIEYHTTSYENQLITIQQNNDTLILFLESPIEVSEGDIVKATGLVQQYQDDWELIIDTPDLISIEQQWEDKPLQLYEIAQTPSKYIKQNLNVTGYVDIIYDDYFQFIDNTHNYHCIVEKPYLKNLSLYTGQHIYLNAFFTYDETQMRYLFEFKNANHTIIPIEEPLT
jgi:hypothetical protein